MATLRYEPEIAAPALVPDVIRVPGKPSRNYVSAMLMLN
jgi:hypothetical protein